MDPEDGRLTVFGPGEEAVPAFTHYGVDSLTELVKMVKADPDCSGAIRQVSDIDTVLTGC